MRGTGTAIGDTVMCRPLKILISWVGDGATLVVFLAMLHQASRTIEVFPFGPSSAVSREERRMGFNDGEMVVTPIGQKDELLQSGAWCLVVSQDRRP